MLKGRVILLSLLLLLLQTAALLHGQAVEHDAEAVECQVLHGCQAANAPLPSVSSALVFIALWSWLFAGPSLFFASFQTLSHWRSRAPPVARIS